MKRISCGTCDAIFPSMMALEAHQEEADHWSSEDDYSEDGDESGDRARSARCDDSPLDTEDEMELDRRDRQLQKDRLFLI